MRWGIAGVLALHGLIHVLGFVKAFDLAKLDALKRPISRPMGIAWLLAAALIIATALLPATSWSWVLATAALIVSQLVISRSWSDARFGTLANVVLLLVAVHAAFATGPFGLRAEYRRAVEDEARRPREPGVVTEADLARLPEPVQRYLRVAGVVGKPRVSRFTATWYGRTPSCCSLTCVSALFGCARSCVTALVK